MNSDAPCYIVKAVAKVYGEVYSAHNIVTEDDEGETSWMIRDKYFSVQKKMRIVVSCGFYKIAALRTFAIADSELPCGECRSNASMATELLR